MLFIRACIFGGLVIGSWLTTVVNYFTFVNSRRPAASHSVMPEWKMLTAIVLSVLVAIYAAYKLADPVFMEWALSGNVDKGGIFSLTTDIGKSDWILVSTGSILLFMSLYNSPRLSAPQQVHWHHIFLKFYFAFTTIAFSGLLAIAIKNLVGRARPAFFDQFDVWYSSPMTDPYMFASFPSGHSTTAGALAAVLFLLAPRFAAIFIAIALWVGISRIAVGAHFPSDVVAGLSLGVIFTWIHARVFARKRLLFEFSENGQLRLRNLAARRARRKIRKNAQSLGDIGFGLPRRAVSK